VHVRWLREKIEVDPNNPRHIITVRSRGYMFRE
jgi:two-component system phosphate regulon response regulator PhoB